MNNYCAKALLLLSLLIAPFAYDGCDPPAAFAAGPTFANGFTSNGPTALNQGTNLTGSIYVNAIADPSAPSVTVNTTGSASHTYYIVGHDGAATCGSGHEGVSAVSAGTTASNSSSPANNAITVPTAYLYYDVLRDATNTSIATCVAGGSVVTDTGQSSSAYSAPAGNTTAQIRNITLSGVSLSSVTLGGTTTAGQINATGLAVSGTLASAAFQNSGTHPATSGLLQDVNAATSVAARNAANGANIAEIGTDANNDIVLGDATNGVFLNALDPLSLLEVAAPGGEAGEDIIYGNSTHHDIEAYLNNGSDVYIPTAAAAGTTNVVSKWTGTNAAMGSSAITDNGTVVSLAEALQLVEQAAPSGAAGKTICWADSTTHVLECKLNNGTAVTAGMASGSFTNTDCVQASVTGGVVTFTDAGTGCAATTAPALWLGQANGPVRSATNYMQFGENYNSTAITVEAQAFSIVTSPNAAVTLKNLYCTWGTVTNLLTITVDKSHGGTVSGTGLSCNSGAATACNDQVDTPTVAGGDLIDIKMVNTSGSQSPGAIECGFQIVGL